MSAISQVTKRTTAWHDTLMTDYVSRARELLEACWEKEYGSGRLAIAREAVQTADLSNDLRTRIDARTELIRAATFCGKPEISLANFAWNLAHYDAEDFASSDIWYQFCWVTEDVPNILAVERDEVEQILDQMEEVFEHNNWWRYPVHIARFRAGVVFGEDRATLRCYLRAYADDLARYGEPTPHDHHVLADAHLRLGDWEAGLAAAANNFVEELDEPEYPHHTHSVVVLPLMLTGRLDEADHHHRTACRLCTRNPVFLRQIGRQITYASHRGSSERVIELVERHLVWALTNFDRWSAMLFYLSAGRALRHLPHDEVKLRLPEEFEHRRDDGRYSTSELGAQLWDEGTALARAFDERHGNTHWGACVDEIERIDDAVVLFHPDA